MKKTMAIAFLVIISISSGLAQRMARTLDMLKEAASLVVVGNVKAIKPISNVDLESQDGGYLVRSRFEGTVCLVEIERYLKGSVSGSTIWILERFDQIGIDNPSHSLTLDQSYVFLLTKAPDLSLPKENFPYQHDFVFVCEGGKDGAILLRTDEGRKALKRLGDPSGGQNEGLNVNSRVTFDGGVRDLQETLDKGPDRKKQDTSLRFSKEVSESLDRALACWKENDTLSAWVEMRLIMNKLGLALGHGRVNSEEYGKLSNKVLYLTGMVTSVDIAINWQNYQKNLIPATRLLRLFKENTDDKAQFVRSVALFIREQDAFPEWTRENYGRCVLKFEKSLLKLGVVDYSAIVIRMRGLEDRIFAQRY